MQANVSFILSVLLLVDKTVTHYSKSNFTIDENYEQLRITNIVRILLNIENLRQQRRANCATTKIKIEMKRVVGNTAGYALQRKAPQILYTDCSKIYKAGFIRSNVFQIWLNELYKFTYIHCDMDVQAISNKTGWITIQKRINGEINFDRGWQNYVDGFGNVGGEHWVGLEHIHALTYQNTLINQYGTFVTPPRMRIDFEDQDGISAYAEYKRFHVAGLKQKYRLIAEHLDRATAIPQNVPSPISAHWFSTYDNTNEMFSDCPSIFHSGWWFFACGNSNLNGLYPEKGDKNSPSNIYWYYWYTVNKNNTALKSVTMKLQY